MDVQNKKVKEGDKWFVYSKDGKKKLGGPYDTEGEADDRMKQVEHFKKIKNQFVSVLFNAKPKLVRNDKMADKDYVVVPMVMLVEGVHAGDQGPYLYPKEENVRRVELWNMKPVVVYHPDTPSACTPEVLNTRQIGIILNAKADEDGKVNAEAWLDEARVKKVDKRVWDAIQNEDTLELSTGLMADSDEEAGEWNGEKYNGTLHNYGPDHLAVLPDQVGACSVEDGAGFYRNAQGVKVSIGRAWTKYFNELCVNTIREQMQKAVLVTGEYRYVEDWSEEKNYLIYSTEKGGLYKQSYVLNGNVVTLSGEAQEVIRKMTYDPIKNETKPVQNQVKGIPNMEKNKIVDGLIANKQFEEKDRDMLTALPDKVLENLIKPVEPAPKLEEKPVVQNAEPKAKSITMEDLPEDLRRVVQNGQRIEKEQKDKFIGIIIKHPKNTFTKEYLATKDVEELQNLANLAMTEEQEKDVQNVLRFNYQGMADPIQNDDCSDVPVLEPPSYQNKVKVA
jgi:hypothetical protein